ncbi:MAG: fimbrillin family protein [Flavobacteriales bacterium]|nr:fimbrillin family protein [Flavobacteriales bacterium]
MKKTLLAVAAIAMGLCSCSKSNPTTSEFIEVSASVSTLAKVSDDGKSFTSGDAISVYAWKGSASVIPATLVVNNSVNTYDGTVWTPAPLMRWDDMTSNHYFMSVFPSKAITNFTADTYTLDPTDQPKSDILVATEVTGRTAAGGIVPLTFDHIMSKIIVSLTFRNEFDETPIVTSLSVKGKTTGTIDYLLKKVSATGEDSDINIPAITANKVYTSIMVPQGITTIDIVINGKTYTYTHNGEIALSEGTSQTVNLIVGRSKIELGSVTINPWGTSQPIDGGEAID